jgi:hypothetical protein
MVHITWTDEKKDKVIEALDSFLKDMQWTSGEGIIQSDNAYIKLPEMFADLVDDVIKPEYVD